MRRVARLLSLTAVGGACALACGARSALWDYASSEPGPSNESADDGSASSSGGSSGVVGSSGTSSSGGSGSTSSGGDGGGSSSGSSSGIITTLPTTNSIYAIAADATNVYWLGGVYSGDPSSTGPCTVNRTPVGGGPVVVLASQPCDSARADIAVDETNVYWVAWDDGVGLVTKVPVDGGALVTISSGSNPPSSLAVDSTGLYWVISDGSGGWLMKAPLDGGAPVTLVDSGVEQIAVDGTNVYWWGSYEAVYGFWKVPTHGGTPVAVNTSINSGPNTNLVVDATGLYWADYGSGGPTAAVMKVPLDGGTPIVLASGQTTPDYVAVDATNLYWANVVASVVMRVPTNGGTPTVVASGQDEPQNVAVNATSVFWTTAQYPGPPSALLTLTPK